MRRVCISYRILYIHGLCFLCRDRWELFGLDCSSVFEHAQCLLCRVIYSASRDCREMVSRSDANQCLTVSKMVATVLVCVGILIFNVGKKKDN